MTLLLGVKSGMPMTLTREVFCRGEKMLELQGNCAVCSFNYYGVYSGQCFMGLGGGEASTAGLHHGLRPALCWIALTTIPTASKGAA